MFAILFLLVATVFSSLTAAIASGNALGVIVSLAVFTLLFVLCSFENTLEIPEEEYKVIIPILSEEWIDPYTLMYWDELKAENAETMIQILKKELNINQCKVCHVIITNTLSHVCFAAPNNNVNLNEKTNVNLPTIPSIKNTIMLN